MMQDLSDRMVEMGYDSDAADIIAQGLYDGGEDGALHEAEGVGLDAQTVMDVIHGWLADGGVV